MINWPWSGADFSVHMLKLFLKNSNNYIAAKITSSNNHQELEIVTNKDELIRFLHNGIKKTLISP